MSSLKGQNPASASVPPSIFREGTLDDLVRVVIEALQATGVANAPSKGPTKELIGALLELTNPRARLSLTETRGRPFSCLGELCWYLAKSNDVDFIAYYIKAYRDFDEDGHVYGGYGPRLFTFRGIDQVKNIVDLLRRKPGTRRAVIQLFDASDLILTPSGAEHLDIPCTCTLQFLIRSDELHLVVNMRSNDVIKGLIHDVFCFTMLQEIIAREVSVEIGTYKHSVGSLHLYDEDMPVAERFLAEGFQSTLSPMPPMPLGSPWPSVACLLEEEAVLRTGSARAVGDPPALDPYWEDLVRLLRIHKAFKSDNAGEITQIRDAMASPIYKVFIDRKLQQLSSQSGH